MDTGMLFKYWNDYKVATDDYNALKDVYDPAVTTYNTTVQEAEKQKSDIIYMLTRVFQSTVELPPRPCNPL